MTLLVFMAAVEESLWHIAGMRTRGAEPRMLCGHRLRGPVHRLFATVDGRRPSWACRTCWGCLLTGQDPDPPTGRHVLHSGHRLDRAPAAAREEPAERPGAAAKAAEHRSRTHPAGRSRIPGSGITHSGVLAAEEDP